MTDQPHRVTPERPREECRLDHSGDYVPVLYDPAIDDYRCFLCDTPIGAELESAP